MTNFADYWEAWAPVWADLEENFFELDSLNEIINELESPVLIVGAGQGLIVEALRNKGFECDGLDLSAEMVKQAETLRGLKLIEGDASDMPIADSSYRSCISTSGVIDFIEDEALIARIVDEMRRVTGNGKVFIAFWHFSPDLEKVCRQMGVLQGNHYLLQKGLEFAASTVSMDPKELAKQPAIGNEKEQKMGWSYYKIFSEAEDPALLVKVSPETQYYRTKDEVRMLCERLNCPIVAFHDSDSSYIVQI